jgi:hypothetical protein
MGAAVILGNDPFRLLPGMPAHNDVKRPSIAAH